jgi:hypothetical protein
MESRPSIPVGLFRSEAFEIGDTPQVQRDREWRGFEDK